MKTALARERAPPAGRGRSLPLSPPRDVHAAAGSAGCARLPAHSSLSGHPVAGAAAGRSVPSSGRPSRVKLMHFSTLAHTVLLLAVPPPAVDGQAPAAACDLATLFAHLSDIQGECCTVGNECSSGYPGAADACNRECGQMFEPFWDSKFEVHPRTTWRMTPLWN
eukprot:COSAG06_NODE_2473_length_6799_cov_3.380299_4_plen_165_part_00